jgi:drug/metabolite transporter (DMT)-like permease
VLLALVWGVSWPIMKVALDEVGIFVLRAAGYSISAVSLFALIGLQGRSAYVPRGKRWVHICVVSFFNVVAFGLLSSLAQLTGTTTRLVIVNYSMPVWACLLAWLLLGERLDRRSVLGLALCIAGLLTLVYPIASPQTAPALLLAWGCALSWAAGTVYMKWAQMREDVLALAAWQIAIAALVFLVALPFAPGPAMTEGVSLTAVLAVLYNGLIGSGFAFVLWFAIIERLPTATASLGVLLAPVVGVGSSMVLLGERPTLSDFFGFALILAAAVCVLVPAGARRKAL